MKLNIKKYENLYSKWLYRAIGSYNPDEINQITITKYPFHAGLRILSTDGYRYIDDIHCKNMFEAVREYKRLIKLYDFDRRDVNNSKE